jgi:hypothetical protein
MTEAPPAPIVCRVGDTVERDRFVFRDVLAAPYTPRLLPRFGLPAVVTNRRRDCCYSRDA